MKIIDKKDMLQRNRVRPSSLPHALLLDGQVRRVLTEQELLSVTNHPFIVSLYHSFQSEKYLYLAMQYCAGGELFTLLQTQKDRRLGELDARFYAAEVLLSLEYLHLLGFLYRDLKPENILVHESGHIVLTDFDLAFHQSSSPVNISPRKRKALWFRVNSHSELRRASRPANSLCSRFRRGVVEDYPQVDTETHLQTGTKRKSFVGTHEFIAPEIIAEEGYLGSCDWWAFGILLYEMVFSKTPFKGSSKMNTLVNIMDTDDALNFPIEVSVSAELKDLLRRLLDKVGGRAGGGGLTTIVGHRDAAAEPSRD
jgi:protein-serine/threonine kinase